MYIILLNGLALNTERIKNEGRRKIIVKIKEMSKTEQVGESTVMD